MLADTYGYTRTFVFTIALQATGTLAYAWLLGIVAREKPETTSTNSTAAAHYASVTHESDEGCSPPQRAALATRRAESPRPPTEASSDDGQGSDERAIVDSDELAL